jgi:hypothetical protein
MPAKVKLPSGTVLSIALIRWSSVDRPDIAEELNADIKTGLAGWGSGYVPDPDQAEAERVAKLFRGEILEESVIDAPSPTGVVY